jgi:DNA-binding NarL/FixJ family response regulator
MTVRVILAGDQPLVRAGLRMLIEQTPDIDVAGEAGTGADAVQLVRDASADVVVMDIRFPRKPSSIDCASTT